MTILPVTPGDVGVWAALRGRLWPDADLDELVREGEAFVAGTRNNIDAVFLAREPGGRVLGFIELSIRAFSDGCDSMPVPHVEGWFVEPDARGRGVGRALMAAAESWARGCGFSELASDTEIHNDGSLRAHERCGFTETERLIKLRKQLA